MSQKVVLVTGGAGFIGSHLVEELVAQGHRVRVVDNLFTGRRENLAHLKESIEFWEEDIREPQVARSAVAGVSHIFHLAALVSVPYIEEHPAEGHQTNITATLHLLESAQKAGVRRFIFASSCAVYGERRLCSEQHPPQPINLYGAQKWMAEQYVAHYGKRFGLATISLRFFNVFGPRQRPDSEYAAVIPRFICRMLAGDPPIIFGDGQQSRDFIYVKDVVQALVQASQAPAEAWGKCWNVGTGKSRNLLELVEALNAILGTSLTPQWAPPRPADIRHSRCNPQNTKKVWGFTPQYSFSQALQHTVEWFQKQIR